MNPTAKASRLSPDDPLRGRTAIIVEDQKLFADFLAGCFKEWGIEVVLNTPSGAEGLAAVNQRPPDLLMLDFSLPDIDGLEIARQVLTDRTKSGLRVVGISSHCDPWTMLQVQKLGLHGFVDKLDQSADGLRMALVSVLSGNVFYTRAVTESSARLRQDPRAFNRVLSDYELKILALIGQAMTDEEIATALGISPTTMQSRRRDIMKKLDIHTTPKLIHYAIVNGLTRPTRT
ncbi:response regulator transcription factor [Oleiharenicola sp. Vm1]|uniref:response regulator transcription factor n=1 Tax=Oleiharenicola sp. Vm1 TaxID=3398393 RepID=UPI0039F4E8C8